MRDLVQEDVCGRGLHSHPALNLISAWPGDFEHACRSVAETEAPMLMIVTGFLIPNASPVAAETDGPLGALFLARALSPCGVKVTIATDSFCQKAVEIGLEECELRSQVPVVVLPPDAEMTPKSYWQTLGEAATKITHLIALERVGPSHTPESVLRQSGGNAERKRDFDCEVSQVYHNRCQTMRGFDVTRLMSPAHLLFEMASRQNPRIQTIGIGDGGNEIGMGKIPWEIIHRNISGGGKIACRIATDDLIVCGISNWGAYALATGVRTLRNVRPEDNLYDPERERALLQLMVENGPLVDGLLGTQTLSVDGLPFERYVQPLPRLKELAGKV
jgi:hypothetical protein